MIVQSLVRYYDILASDDSVSISRPGYSPAKVSFALVISHDGRLSNIIDLRTEGKKPLPKMMEVPYQKSRSSGIKPFFLCDNEKYVFGVEFLEGKEKEKILSDASKFNSIIKNEGNEAIVVSKRSLECFDQFRKLQHSLLDRIEDPAIKGFLKFLDLWKPEGFLTNPKIQEYLDEFSGGNFVFECEGKYLHMNPAAQQIWENIQLPKKKGSEINVTQCLVSGLVSPIAKTHQPIKGVDKSHTMGAPLISFNEPSFCSYNKDQSLNAPVSESAMFKYTTALNHLLRWESKNRLRIGDTTTVFWAETSKKTCEDLAHFLINPIEELEETDGNETEGKNIKQDLGSRQLMSDILQKVRSGNYLEEKDLGVDPDKTNFYILGLAPNNARLAVRFWHEDHFGNFITRVARHHLDMEIIRDDRGPQYISVYRLLKETLPKKILSKKSNDTAASPLLGGLLMRSILENTPYPIPMYNAILNRVKVERSINYAKAGFIKACLIRLARTRGNHEEDLITVSLNEKNQNVPYRLGRLFAILESTQKTANPNVKRTIRDSYFASASSAPAVVYPVLLKLSQHHLSKINSEKPGLGVNISKSMDEVMSSIDRFPVNLSLEEQGLFMLGYYHQHESFFRKNDEPKTVEEELKP